MSADPSSAAATLAARIDDRSARICIVGLGYVGVPTAVAFAQEGFDVVGVDVDAARCGALNAGRSYIDDVASDDLRALFETIVDSVVALSSPAAAEMTKLFENTFRGVNIALANEVAIMCRRLGLDVWEVIGAASSKPYGFMPFYPGPGLGGQCIPVDPTCLSWKLRRPDYVARFIDLAEDINHHMPDYVAARAADILNEQGKSVKDSKILVLGVAYKPDVADLRDWPALDLIAELRRRGALTSYADPHVPDPIQVDGVELVAEKVTSRLLSWQDLFVVATDHSGFDWELVRRHARSVLDTRGLAWRRGFSDWHTL